MCNNARHEFSPFVSETYDLMAPHTKALLYRLADIAPASVDILDITYRNSRKANKGQKFTKWTKQLWLARIETMRRSPTVSLSSSSFRRREPKSPAHLWVARVAIGSVSLTMCSRARTMALWV